MTGNWMASLLSAFLGMYYFSINIWVLGLQETSQKSDKFNIFQICII